MSSNLLELLSIVTKKHEDYKKLMNILCIIIGQTIENLIYCDDETIPKNKKGKNMTNYIKHFINKVNLEPSTLILSTMYLDRLCSKGKFKLNTNNACEIFLICLILAIKFNEEYFENNYYYSKIVGINNRNLNKLEKQALRIINFNLYVYEEQFKSYINQFSELFFNCI